MYNNTTNQKEQLLDDKKHGKADNGVRPEDEIKQVAQTKSNATRDVDHQEHERETIVKEGTRNGSQNTEHLPQDVVKMREELEAALSVFDKNKDGLIRVTDIKEVLTRIGDNRMLTCDVDFIMHSAQAEENGQVSVQRLMELILHNYIS
ncbi:hypothetical protein M8J75_008345 [Diaphorina citri]|nr:hypothetical protein M8J75_008345 [Diaphorina citri]KAI5735184.1 hypothetical protein M8J77_015271 [Diaphorina citri]